MVGMDLQDGMEWPRKRLNPYWTVNNTSINEKRDRVIGFLTAKFKITDWLSLSGRANMDKTFDRGDGCRREVDVLLGVAAVFRHGHA